MAVGEQAKQFAANLVPDDAGEGPAAPCPPAGVASARWGGLMVGQDSAQRGDGSGLLTGPLQLGEGVPHGADQVAVAWAVSQPVQGFGWTGAA
ncbi:MAG: hypothetical protein ACRDSZ_00725 [Pseudonocardiaceae bacterium]